MSHKFKEHGDKNAACDSEEKEVCEQCASEASEPQEAQTCDDTDAQIQKLQNELSEITDKFYRANADFENLKKRLEKEKDSAVAYASESFAKDLLPIIDALEEAAKIDVEGNELADKIEVGVKQCLSLFTKTFEKYGIVPIATDGGFDPSVHNAISMIEAEGANSGDIVQVYQKGYMYKQRVLRAAMVVVAK
ncbi:nucleotide exchange factor GrpE [uncultured Campylobacter sp.]|uniref:nucleotide exchange factor GrpE n=1 Tax=uncultured Campylobacter sp. TaxID=218934 RepID=UPI002629AB73|nr:nucleotide exchange factor GrpE [uncultured Campylobacter sp.]